MQPQNVSTGRNLLQMKEQVQSGEVTYARFQGAGGQPGLLASQSRARKPWILQGNK